MTDPFVPPDGDTPEPKWATAADRQETRQAGVPGLYKTTLERLAVELAMGMDEPENIFKTYGYTPEQAANLMNTPHFTALLTRIGADIRENGVSFKMKIRAIAEDLLPHMHDLATDPLQSAAVRADIGKWAAKLAGWEPGPNKGEVAGGGGFTLAISFSGQPVQTIISGREPITLEHQGA